MLLIFSWWRRWFAPDSVANKPPALEYDIWTWQINTHVELERSLGVDLLSCYQSPPATICLRSGTNSQSVVKRALHRWTEPFPCLRQLSPTFLLCNSNTQIHKSLFWLFQFLHTSNNRKSLTKYCHHFSNWNAWYSQVFCATAVLFLTELNINKTKE